MGLLSGRVAPRQWLVGGQQSLRGRGAPTRVWDLRLTTAVPVRAHARTARRRGSGTTSARPGVRVCGEARLVAGNIAQRMPRAFSCVRLPL